MSLSQIFLIISTVKMFILLSLFITCLAVSFFGWLTIIFMGALLFLPQLLYVVLLLQATIFIFVFAVICTWLGFRVFMVVLGWIVGLISWVFGLMAWIFGKQGTKVVVRSP